MESKLSNNFAIITMPSSCNLFFSAKRKKKKKKKKQKTTISLNQMIFHVSRNYICKPQGSKFKNAQNTSFFFFYVLWNIKTWNSKITPWKQTPQNQKFKILFTLN
jgi:hypothetical protein